MTMWKKSNDGFSRSLNYLGNYEISNAVTLRMASSYNGSGESCFNGFREWPTVSLHVPLPAGRTDMQQALASELKDFIDGFISRHNLMDDQSVRTRGNTYEVHWKKYNL